LDKDGVNINGRGEGGLAAKWSQVWRVGFEEIIDFCEIDQYPKCPTDQVGGMG
jgi:hypothetical protein